MDLNSAWVFVRVAQAGSFSAAAKLLGMPVSTVSTRVSRLEERLGATLLRRTTRKLHLTDAGSRYLEHAQTACEAMRLAEASTAEAQEEASGPLRLTAPIEMGSTSLIDVISDFLAKHPRIQVELLLTDRLVDLLGEGVDLAVRIGELKDSSLVAKKIGTTEFHAFASPAYLRRKGEPRRPADLERHDCLGFQGPVAGHWELLQAGRAARVRVQGPASVNNLFALHRLALLGRGIALLPAFLCAEDLNRGRLRQVLRGWKAEASPVNLVYPQQKFPPLRLRALVDFLSAHLRDLF